MAIQPVLTEAWDKSYSALSSSQLNWQAFLSGRMSANAGKLNFLTVTDIGHGDPDDWLAVLLSCERANQLAVLTNESCAFEKAAILKGILGFAGEGTVPVAMRGKESSDEEFSREIRARYDSVFFDELRYPTSHELFSEALRRSPRRGITLLMISGFSEVAEFLRDSERNQELFCRSVGRVGIQGGVLCDAGGNPIVTRERFLMPDDSQNYRYAPSDAAFVMEFLQRNGIQIIFFSRYAATSIPFKTAFYDRLAATGNPQGALLREIAMLEFHNLLLRARMPVGDPKRRGLVERCNVQWMHDRFGIPFEILNRHLDVASGVTTSDVTPQELWAYNKQFSTYDPLLGFFMSEDQRRRHCSPYYHVVNNVEHVVIGVSSRDTGITDPDAIRREVEDTIVSTLTRSAHQAQRILDERQGVVKR